MRALNKKTKFWRVKHEISNSQHRSDPSKVFPFLLNTAMRGPICISNLENNLSDPLFRCNGKNVINACHGRAQNPASFDGKIWRVRQWSRTWFSLYSGWKESRLEFRTLIGFPLLSMLTTPKFYSITCSRVFQTRLSQEFDKRNKLWKI